MGPIWINVYDLLKKQSGVYSVINCMQDTLGTIARTRKRVNRTSLRGKSHPKNIETNVVKPESQFVFVFVFTIFGWNWFIKIGKKKLYCSHLAQQVIQKYIKHVQAEIYFTPVFMF